MSLNFKTKVPQNGFRNITKEEQEKVNSQIAEIALRNAVKEVNESLNFCWSTTMLTCLGLFDPEMLKIFEEKFKQSVEILKKSNPLGVDNIEDINGEIESLKNIMLCGGACGAMMTGSGSCVFGLFKEKAEAQKCAEKIKKNEKLLILRNL